MCLKGTLFNLREGTKMGLAITSNFGIGAGYAANNMRNSQALMSKSINHISSGKKAANPVDDIVSYMKGLKLKGDSIGNSVMESNVQTVAARVNAIDSTLSNITDGLLEMKNLAVSYAAAGSSNSTEQAALAAAFSTLKTAVGDMAKAQYAGDDLFTSSAISVLVSLDGSTSMTFSATSVMSSPSSLVTALSVGAAVSSFNTALESISTRRAKLGGYLSALDQISSYLSSMASTTDAAYSAVTDVDIAKEMTSYVKNNIQSQAAQAMISQANQSLAQTINLLQF
jgi:flagellin